MKECLKGLRVCFSYNQAGHVKAECLLLVAKPVLAPTPVTLRTIDGHRGKLEALNAMGRAFKLTAEEAKTIPVVFAGTFLVNSIPGLMLFASGASRSFISTISISHEALDRPLKVVVVDDRMVSASKVYRGYVLDIFGVRFSIDLIPIVMEDVWVIVGMDWLSQFRALIDCENQLVTIRNCNTPFIK